MDSEHHFGTPRRSVAPDEDLAAGWLTRFRRGVLSGAGLLLLATALCTIPAFLVWLVPGADTTPASSAVKAGGLLVLSAAHGGVLLNGTAVSLAPLLITLLLAVLVAGQARRADSWSGVVGLSIGYGAASAALAGWARLGSTRAPVGPSVLAAVIFVIVAGGLTRAAQQGWPRLPLRWQRIGRAAAVAGGVYLLAGTLLAAGALAVHFHDAVALQRHLSPGATGLPVALLGIAGAPNAVLAAVGYLTGPGFSIGTHTSVSVVSVSHGPLPAFPLLAGVPHGRPVTVAGVLVIGLLALLIGWLVLRVIAADGSWLNRLADAAAVAVLTAAGLAALSALGSGSLGPGALHRVGEVWWALGLSTMLVLLFGSAAWLAIEALRGKPATVSLAEVHPLRLLGRHGAGTDAADEDRPSRAAGMPAAALAAEPADRPNPTGQQPAGGSDARPAPPSRSRNAS